MSLTSTASTIDDAQFEQDLVAYFRTIDFGARPVQALVLRYPIDFHPD